jgi:D-erythronate 2-dehydrogenase
MVNVLVTGAGGFLGARLARELLAAGSVSVAGRQRHPLDRLTLIDRVPIPPDLAADGRVTAIQGDLADLPGPGEAGPGPLEGGPPRESWRL